MLKTALYILTGPMGSGSCRIRLLPSVTLVDCRLGLSPDHDHTLWLYADGAWYHNQAARCFQWQLPPFSTLPIRPAVLDEQGQLVLSCRNDTAVKYEIARVIAQEQQQMAPMPTEPVTSPDTTVPAGADQTVVPQSIAADGVENTDESTVSATPVPPPTDTQNSAHGDAAIALETMFDIQQVDTDQTTVQDNQNQSPSPTDTRQSNATGAVDWEKLYLGEHPLYQPLMQRIDGSRWVRIDDDDAWYVVGLLYDSNNTPTHACYGVYGSYDVPLCPQAEWLPQSVDDWHGQGYWIIYQQLQLPADPASGQC